MRDWEERRARAGDVHLSTPKEGHQEKLSNTNQQTIMLQGKPMLIKATSTGREVIGGVGFVPKTLDNCPIRPYNVESH